MEGAIVDTGSSSYDTSLVSLNNTIYVGIKRLNNILLIKAKETTNSLISLNITPPTKVTYEIGETLDKTGLKVIANYTKGQKEINNYILTNFNTDKVGTFNATITYEGFSNTFTYNVINKKEDNTDKDNLAKIENGNYVIRSSLDYNKVLDVYSGANKSGTNVQLYDYNASNAQVWNISYLKDGYYKISSQLNNNLVLDVFGSDKNNGANVQIYNSNNSKAQQWLIKESGDGYYYLISACNDLNLDIVAGQTSNGTNIQMYKGNATKAQKFKLDKQDKTIEDGSYVIRSSLDYNKVLDVYSGANKSGTNVQLYDYNASNAQIWNITYLKDGYYKISSQINNNLVLDVFGADKNNGANVQVYDSNNSTAQQWFIKESGDGYYYLISVCNCLNIDIVAGQTSNGTNIQMYKGNLSKAQKFKLDRL